MKRDKSLSYFKQFCVAVLLIILASQWYVPSVTYAQLKMDPADHWSVFYIDQGVQKGYLPFTDSISPEKEVTRGEFLAYISKAIALKPIKKASDSIWYDPYVSAAVEAGIHRYEDFTSGNWDSNLTRKELMRMTARAVDPSLVSGDNDEQLIYTSVKQGVVGGIWDGTLGLDLPVTQGYAAMVLHKILEVKSGKTFEPDRSALSYAEVAYTGTNIKAVWGDAFDTVKLPYKVDTMYRTSIDFTVDQILIVDTTNPSSAFYSKYAGFQEARNVHAELKQKEKYLVAIHIKVDAAAVPKENMKYVYIPQMIRGEGIPVYFQGNAVNDYNHGFFREGKENSQTDGWLTLALMKDEIDEYIKFGEFNFSIEVTASGVHNELTLFHKKTIEQKPVKLSDLLKERTIGVPFPYYRADTPTLWTPIDIQLNDGIVSRYQVYGKSVSGSNNYYSEYDRLMYYWMDGKEYELAFKQVPGLSIEDRNKIIDQLVAGDPTGVAKINELLGLNKFQEVDTPHIIDISGSSKHRLALSSDGFVYAWGSNGGGQLGKGDLEPLFPAVPQRVEKLTDIVDVHAGESYSLALKKDGTVWAWGSDFIEFNREPVVEPLHIPELDGAVKIFGTNRSVIVQKGDGSVWEFGYLYTYADKLRQKQIEYVNDVFYDWGHFALKEDGTVWRWDTYADYAFANKPDSYLKQPRMIEGINEVVAIGRNGQLLMAKKDGSVWQWDHYSNTLTKYDAISGVVTLSGRFALKDDGTVWELIANTAKQVEGLSGIKVLNHGIAISEDGKVYSWGYDAGIQGNGSLKERDSSMQEVRWNPWKR